MPQHNLLEIVQGLQTKGLTYLVFALNRGLTSSLFRDKGWSLFFESVLVVLIGHHPLIGLLLYARALMLVITGG